MRATVAVRLEGGIGDHILGLRLPLFVRQKHPDDHIILYSDAAGGEAQLDIARMCPVTDHAIALNRNRNGLTLETMGDLKGLLPSDLEKLRSAEYFYDASGDGFFLEASRALSVPFYEILARRPELRVPDAAKADAEKRIGVHADRILVGLNLAKYGADWVKHGTKSVQSLLLRILEDSRVIVLNLYVRRFDYAHWPQDYATARAARTAEEAEAIATFGDCHERIKAVADAPIQTVAAILERCRYFIGFDNGIKHLAWALGIPHTLFMTELPDRSFTLRWVPDYHRVLTFNCGEDEITSHAEDAAICFT
jgi:hypothetical protein